MGLDMFVDVVGGTADHISKEKHWSRNNIPKWIYLQGERTGRSNLDQADPLWNGYR